MQNSDIEKYIKMAASEHFIFEIFLNGYFSKAAIFILEILAYTFYISSSDVMLKGNEFFF